MPSIVLNNTALKPGMTVSNEPGYYEDGKYGIRIENVVLVKEADTPNNFGQKGYLGFEHVTLYVFSATFSFPLSLSFRHLALTLLFCSVDAQSRPSSSTYRF